VLFPVRDIYTHCFDYHDIFVTAESIAEVVEFRKSPTNSQIRDLDFEIQKR
jgi:hypothetical protein